MHQQHGSCRIGNRNCRLLRCHSYRSKSRCCHRQDYLLGSHVAVARASLSGMVHPFVVQLRMIDIAEIFFCASLSIDDPTVELHITLEVCYGTDLVVSAVARASATCWCLARNGVAVDLQFRWS